VRLALKHALDRQEMVDKILYGYGAVGQRQPDRPGAAVFLRRPAVNSYDPDKARFHLGQAGSRQPRRRLSPRPTPPFTGAMDAGCAVLPNRAAAGINLSPSNARRTMATGATSGCRSRGLPPIGAVVPPEDWMFTTAYAAGAPWNESYWDNERFNDLAVAGSVRTGRGYRAARCITRCSHRVERGRVIIPMFASYVMGVSDAVATPDVVGANWDLDGFRRRALVVRLILRNPLNARSAGTLAEPSGQCGIKTAGQGMKPGG
jgi:peptide/nickel transport system substrate-binding protein